MAVLDVEAFGVKSWILVRVQALPLMFDLVLGYEGHVRVSSFVV